MAVADEILRLQQAKEAIRQAIIAKGQSVSQSDLLGQYASKIANIQTGGTVPDPEPEVTVSPYTIDSGGVVYFNKNLVFPRLIDGIVARYIEGWDFSWLNLTSVDMSDSEIIDIGQEAFADNSIATLSLPPTLEVIGVSAFANNSLTSLFLPDSLVSVGANAFTGNPLTQVSIASTTVYEPDSFPETAVITVRN